MMGKVSVLVAGRNKKVIDVIGQSLMGMSGANIEVRHISNGHVDPLYGLTKLPEILILGLGEIWEEELHALNTHPAGKIQLIVVSQKKSEEMMRLAMQAGARDFFTGPLSKDELVACVHKITKELSDLSKSGKGSLTAVMNANGGSGASFISCNFAHIMVSHLGYRTALLDLDLQFATLSTQLGLTPQESIIDAIEKVEHLDSIALAGYVSVHSSGLHLFSSVNEHIPQPWTVSEFKLRKLLSEIQDTHDQVIADLPRIIDPLTKTVLEEADNILIVLEQRVTHIHGAKRLHSMMTQDLAIPSDRVHLVINRFDKKVPISADEIRQTLKVKSVIKIPNESQKVMEAVNMGVPLYDSTRKTPVTQAIVKMAEEFSPKVVDKKQGFLKAAVSQWLGT